MKIKLLFLALFVGLIVISCPEPTQTVFPYAFDLQFSVENKTDAPVTVRVRNYYCWGSGEPVVSYSDWVYETLESLETKPLGGGTGEFTLLNHTLGTTVATEMISSFEIEVGTHGKTISLAGYSAEDPRFDDTGLCFLKLIKHFETQDRIAMLYTKKQYVRFECNYALPVKLIINGDGTYLFDEESVRKGDKITILKP
jgi:hypothetical protein